ncbi:uncharacterized protein LOC116777374 [Danaus plexippus]|uniref:Uncharacterized protein n=1 Tax=Danaus plexippus plexippus TaxID=278856 RepID=A0A212EXJ9_DANPL|nr:uncharacterized protein LOC116777374 [Danaus plexippus]OWR46222.1 hypothetical protein KGM_200081 [Danaus plexippus plexippus]
MDSEVCVLDDYSSSSDEEDKSRECNIKYNQVFSLDSLNKFYEQEMSVWFDYVRTYVPLMKLMLEDYKMKWESYQFRQYAKINDPYYQESDEDSDTSNGSVTSAIIEGFPNGDKNESVVLSVGRENIKAGYYMFLSYFQGGWFYPEVKKYFRQKHGVRCFRSESTKNALSDPDDFRALIKFRTVTAMDYVFEKLYERNMLKNFTFVCIEASEKYFNDAVISQLRNTEGCIGLPSFHVCMRQY